jgi:predicted RNA-binding protein with PIN domain
VPLVRPWPCRRGAVGLTTPDTRLRRALTVAVEVARAGEASTPRVPAPTGLVPFLRFARLPAPALAAARRVLDSDDAFRARVADSTSEDVVGRVGWLFLTRPEGWAVELDDDARAQTEIIAAAAEARVEQDAQRRVARLEANVARLEGELTDVRRELDVTQLALTDARRARTEATGRVRELEARLAAAREERDRRRVDAQAAAEEVARLRGALAARDKGRAVDVERVAGAVADATAAAERLRGALEAARTELHPPDEAVAVEATPPSPARPLMPPAVRRKPVALPPAVLDDSIEAAAALVRVNGMVLLVDGYNVAMLGWPSRPIPEQRSRLIDALAQLVARTGADVEVVFDGAEDAPAVVPGDRRGVRVSFSPPDVEADDVVISRAAEVPVHRPVTVASNDRRVQDGARAAGANVISSAQLLAVLRH